MIKSNFLTIFILCLTAIFGTAAQSDCSSKKSANAGNGNKTQNAVGNNKMEDEKTEPVMSGEIKVLAEGSFGAMEQPFLFVARDAETYARLKNTIKNLPDAAGIDFKNQAVVAAFAGTKNTGGYSVEIKNTGAKIAVSLNSPPPDAMVTEALTMPYKIAAVPLGAANSMNLEIGENWKKTAQTYKVSSGEFEYSGGIDGRRKTFAAAGWIDVYRFADLVTLRFDLSGAGAGKNMKLADTVSGVLSGNKIELARLDAGSFSENPKPPLKVSGTLSNNKLELNFEPLPTMISDGFQARGKLEAVQSK
jgi:hypothetical protein